MRRKAVLSGGPQVQTGGIDSVTEQYHRPSVPTISVVIPTLNEAGNLPYVLNTIPHWVGEIIIVDGRSSDDTERVARVLRPDVKIVHVKRRGKGAALIAGLEAATGDILIMRSEEHTSELQSRQ